MVMVTTLVRSYHVVFVAMSAIFLIFSDASPVHRSGSALDAFDTLSQTLRQQKYADDDEGDYAQYVNDYDEYADYYEEKGGRQFPPRDDLATVVWAPPPPPLFQRGQRRNWRSDVDYVGDSERQRLLLDTFADYLWQLAMKNDDKVNAKRIPATGQVSVATEKISQTDKLNQQQHIKNATAAADDKNVDELIGQLNKLKTN